jgi:drug/metabolite transporter (DMT)-like permease
MTTPIPAILPAPPPVLRAALWMTGAIASFSAMAVAGREAALDLDTFEIMFYRSIVGLVIVCVILSVTGRWHQVSRRHPGLQLMRNLAHFSGQNLWFYAITVIPLAQVFALEFTSPLWVLVLSPLVLGERMTRIRVLAAVMGFIGILIVARPGAESLNAGVVTAALSAVCFALTIMLTKKLTRTESVACILLYLNVTQVVFGLIAAGYDGDIALPSAISLPWVVLIGVAGLLAHFCLTNALSIAPATVVVPLDFARLPFIAVIGMLLYQEPLDLFVFAGALVIFGGNYLNIWYETRRPR